MGTPSAITAFDSTFPSELPAQLHDAWRVLESRPQLATISALSDARVRIVLRRNPRGFWPLAICGFIGGVLGMIGVWLFDRYQHSPSYDLPVRYGLTKLYLLAGCLIGGSIMVALIQLAGGGDRDTVLEASPGKLKVDRWVSGDHLVGEYAADDIGMIWTDSAITFQARGGDFSVAMLSPRNIQIAAAEIIATTFWGDKALVTRLGDPTSKLGSARISIQRVG